MQSGSTRTTQPREAAVPTESGVVVVGGDSVGAVRPSARRSIR